MGAKVNKKSRTAKRYGNYLFRLQICILFRDVLNTRAILLRIQVVMSHDQGFRITPMQIF